MKNTRVIFVLMYNRKEEDDDDTLQMREFSTYERW